MKKSPQSGLTAIEYGLIAALIAVAVIAIIQGFSENKRGHPSGVQATNASTSDKEPYNLSGPPIEVDGFAE